MPQLGRGFFVVFGVLGAGAFAVQGCSDDTAEERAKLAQLAQGCSLNSDCATPLICAFQRCHTQCQESRDCPTGQRCVKTEDPAIGVCQLPDEKDCGAGKPNCRGSQTCGPDAECRDGCTTDTDCFGGQKCAKQNVCAEPDELDADGNLKGLGDAGTGGSGGSGGSGGTGGSGGSGGTSGSGGAGGSGGTGGITDAGGDADAGCPADTGECDSDPKTVCEADLTLITSCGGCTTTCSTQNATGVTCQSGVCNIGGCVAGFASCDTKPETGCETDLKTNAKHCGACGKDCAGTTCTNGACDDVILGSIPTGTGPKSSAVSANHVFVAYAGSQWGLTRFDKSPSGKLDLVSNATWSAVTVDATDVYYANGSVIWKMPLGGTLSAATTVTTAAATVQQLANSGNALYYTTGAEIRTVSKSGASDSKLYDEVVAGNSLTSLVAVGGELVWRTGSSVRSGPIGGGSAKDIVTPNHLATELAADATHAYFSNYQTTNGFNVWRYAPGTSAAQGLYTQALTAGMALGPADVIFANSLGGANTELRKAPKGGAGGSSTVLKPSTVGTLLGADATHFYGMNGSEVRKIVY